ncbi:MAG: MaoC family dehydratase N-terminal domain-containing protein [Deltaproteobacteria bacterium]|nr:MaoC family dehydratase N-terminal domain-containing protein [Deltaproteobacteria bacterium]
MEKKVLYFEDVREGDEAPPLVVPNITRTQIVKYAGASGDFNPIHHDELYAIRAGNDRIFAMGMMTAGFLSHMITDWVGGGNLRKYRVRFATRIWPSDTVTCKGKITMKYTEEGKNYIEADTFAENQRAEKAVMGTIVAELPSKAKE